MSEKKSRSLKEVLAEFNQDPAFWKAYRIQKPYHDLVRQIINRRVEIGLTQTDLAERAETHQSRISKIESAKHDIRLSTLISIAEALETRVEIRLVPEPVNYQSSNQDYLQLFGITGQTIGESVQIKSEKGAEKEVTYHFGLEDIWV